MKANEKQKRFYARKKSRGECYNCHSKARLFRLRCQRCQDKATAVVMKSIAKKKNRQRDYYQENNSTTSPRKERNKEWMRKYRLSYGLVKALKEWKAMQKYDDVVPVFYLSNGRNLHESPASTLKIK